MRYEQIRNDALTKYWRYKLKRITDKQWHIYITYGFIIKGKDAPLQKYELVFMGTWLRCKTQLKKYEENRLALGYKKV